MSSKNLLRRLERLEAELAPPSDKPALTITVPRADRPGEIKEIHLVNWSEWRRPWRRNGRGDR
jgi:hypothetical protein